MTFRLGVRLAVAGGRESLLRLAVTAFGVAVGVVLLLLCLTGQSAEQGRAERSGWQSADAGTPATAPDPALFLTVTDYHQGIAMIRGYVAALGPRPPVPPGLDRLPGPGEVAVSPAMRRLLASTPDDELDDRYPGRVVATIGDRGLAHPDQLVALIGRTPEQLGEVTSRSLYRVRGFGSLPSGYAFHQGIRVLLVLGAVLLLVPVVIFIVMATRVAAAHRSQRLAAIRLAGATRLQTAVVAAVETGLGALAGAALGWAGYELGRRVVAATLTFQGARFFVDDIAVAPWLLALVLAGVPLLAMLTTIVALGRVQAGPLATSRHGRRPPPTARRALPLAAGLGGLLAAAPLRRVADSETGKLLDNLAPLFVILTIVGFVAIGPWLCLLAGRGIARVSRRVPGLIAARRIASDPSATFRAVSVVVLAAFAVTCSASLVDAAEEPVDRGHGVLRPGVVEVLTGGVPAARVAPLLAERAVAVRSDIGVAGDVVASCAELARVVTLPCSPSGFAPGGIGQRSGPGDSDLPVSLVYVTTDGTPAAENRVRTQAANLVPNAIIHTQRDRIDTDAFFFDSLEQLQRLVWYFILLVAACSLTVGMLAGVIERRRPFALLRASGLRLGELRQVVFLETAAAMLVTAAVGVGLGMASSYAFALFGDLTWRWPDAGVFTMVGVGVLAALVLSTLALPLLDSSTRPDAVRFE
ncbi:MAG TPA: FtsX-like permease family protein [Actinomycetota bacterium]|nr:FtsX-like permease family protein [Actinomycetota bacterium]